MKCSCCGGEIPEGEILCPLCGEDMTKSQPNKKDNKKRLLAGGLAVLICGGVIAGALAMAPQGGKIDIQEIENLSSVVTYTTKKSVHTLLPENNQELTLIQNAAKDLNSFSTFSSIIQESTSYAGQNFVRIGDETLFLRTTLNSIDNSTQTYDVDYELCSVKPGEEPVVVDTDVQSLTCMSDNSLYYLKGNSEAVYQYRYNKDGITRISDMFSADFVRVTHCSDDDSFASFVAADLDENNNIIMKNGFFHNGHPHLLPEEEADNEIYFVSPDGKHVYLMDITDENGRVVTLKYLSDHENVTLTTIAENVSEFVFYEDSGNAAYIANVALSDEVMNPVGELHYFDAAAQSSQILAEKVVALVESADKSYYWLNENSREMLVTEQSGINTIPAEAAQLHFIDEAGKLCAADKDGKQFVISEGFYEPETYSYNPELMFLTEKDGAFFWAQGDSVYKYSIGSMTAPETVTLDADINSKLESGLEIGYILADDGSVLEQSSNTLNMKPFGQPSYTVYDGPESIIIVGLSADGEKIYFVDHSCTLMEKELSEKGETVILAENVYDALVVSNGLYILTDYSENGGTLQYRSFADKEFRPLRDGVVSMIETIVQ